MLNIVIFGKPGAGKGTQAEFLKSKYNLIHISTGDLFRYHIKNKTPLGLKVTSILENGDLVPDALTVDILENEVNRHKKTNGFIFDGFPRTINQAISLENKLKQLNVNIKSVLNLDITNQKILKRLAGRGREDDKPELIKNRLKVYRNQTEPLLEFYSERSLLETINGDQSETDVSSAIINVLKAEVA